ncbi:MAG: methyltransferase domain-containing protein [Chloroflexi bacterium]|nr:methyltransferase domain-containing protein [Chloroflexota bacterium]
MNTSTSEYYNHYWSPTEGWSPVATLSPLKRGLIHRIVRSGDAVLDVGCGDGAHYGRLLASTAGRLDGLDVSKVAVENAKPNGIAAQVHDLQSAFPFEDATYNVVLCIEVLEHVFDPALVVSEMRRVLRPDGLLLVSVPNVAHAGNRLRMMLGGFSPGGSPDTSSRRPWADPHIRFFTVKSLRSLITEQHLHIKELHGEGVSLFSTLPLVSSWAAKVVGWRRLERWSQSFEFLARVKPSLWAGHLIVVAGRK